MVCAQRLQRMRTATQTHLADYSNCGPASRTCPPQAVQTLARYDDQP